jgi:hypothetical protein
MSVIIGILGATSATPEDVISDTYLNHLLFFNFVHKLTIYLVHEHVRSHNLAINLTLLRFHTILAILPVIIDHLIAKIPAVHTHAVTVHAAIATAHIATSIASCPNTLPIVSHVSSEKSNRHAP